MSTLSDQISTELQVLVGQPLGDCWRGSDMAIFEFGPRRQVINRRGEPVEVSDISLHIQCHWRFVDAERILFGRDDLYYPGDATIASDDFDWGEQDSLFDIKRRAWFEQRRKALPKVVRVSGDAYGGFRLELEERLGLECFPCESQKGNCSEHWRLFGHRPDGEHFVVTDDGAMSVGND